MKLIKIFTIMFALPFMLIAAAFAHQNAYNSADMFLEFDATTIASSIPESPNFHILSLNEKGMIEGRIATGVSENGHSNYSTLNLYFVSDGEVVAETVTDEEGQFVIEGVTEGVYSFVAAGEKGFAAYGVRVLTYEKDADSNVLDTAVVSASFAKVSELLGQYLPESISADIESLEIDGQYSAGTNRIRMKDGKLIGTVFPMHADSAAGTTIHILQDGKNLQSVEASEDGSFVVDGLDAGRYDFVASGEIGFAAVSFELFADEKIDADGFFSVTTATSNTYASTASPRQDYYFDSLEVPLAEYEYYEEPYEEIVYYEEPIYYEEGVVYNDDRRGGYFSGGGSPGQGGIGRGGRLGGRRFGRIALLGGLVGGIIAIANDDNPTDPGGMSPNN